MTGTSLARDVEHRYGLASLREPQPLAGGYANQVVRLGPVVARTAPVAATEETLGYEHALVAALAASVPEVRAPLTALDGSTFWQRGERLVSVWPWIPGRRGDRRSRRLRVTAGAVLASIHRAGLELGRLPPRPGQPALGDLELRSNWMWDLDAALAARPAARLEEACAELVELVAAWRRGGLSFGPVHSDYYPGNVIALRGTVVGVIDWDYARPEWLAWEVGRSVWEFAKDKRRHDLRPERAGEFLRAYRAAAGPVPTEEERLLVPMMRVVRLEEALHQLTNAARGLPWDRFYTGHNPEAFENLRRQPEDAAERWLAAAEPART